MSVKIEIPSYLQPFTNNIEVVEVNGDTVGECISHLIAQFPSCEKMLFDKDCKLHAYVGIYINGEDAYPDELVRPVEDGAELYILYIIGGG